jgi:hypothetical protein
MLYDMVISADETDPLQRDGHVVLLPTSFFGDRDKLGN